MRVSRRPALGRPAVVQEPMASRAKTGAMAPREKRESQAKGSEVYRALLGSWALKESKGPLGYQEQWAKKGILEIVQFVRAAWIVQKEELCKKNWTVSKSG